MSDPALLHFRRDHFPALVGRIDRRLERTFRRMIEIARQDEERTGLLRDAGKGKSARARITYRVVASAFHDNTRMTPADVAYA